MELIGLTGGIGSGKSTVATLLRGLGVTVIDADEAARAVVEPGAEGFALVANEFGVEYISGGQLDRSRLAELVFHDQDARLRLEAITHPLVRRWMADRAAESIERGESRVVYDIPLLFERGLDIGMRAVIVVWAPPELQIRRMMEGRGYDRKQAQARIAAQMPIDEKRARADHVIDNSGTRDRTREQTFAIWHEITGWTQPGRGNGA